MSRRLSLLATAFATVALVAACGSSTPSGAAPTDAGAGASPSTTLRPDPGLAAKFPSTIDNQPVTDVQTAFYSDALQQFGRSAADVQSETDTLNGLGLAYSEISFGTAKATVDGNPVSLIALRTANRDAHLFVQNYGVIANAFGNTDLTSPTLVPTTIAGKNVTVVTSSAGDVSTLYVTGDVMFILQKTTDSQNLKIVQALP